jgi:uncharacterized membrane protein YfcA
MTILVIYLGAGLVAGFLAGLVGTGSSLILVRALAAVFLFQGLSEMVAFPMAIATSLLTIPFTSVVSVRAHNGRGAVDWASLRRFGPGAFAGSLLGTALVPPIPTDALRTTFTVCVALAAAQTLFNVGFSPVERTPPRPAVTAAGSGVGVICALVSTGGGMLSIPFMVLSRLPFRSAIGTTSAAGSPAAIVGTLGYIGTGFASHIGTGDSVGYINLPALTGVVAASVFSARLGVRVSQ